MPLTRITSPWEYVGRGIAVSRAEEYRRRSQQCLELAQHVSTWDGRIVPVQMAQTWLRLAEEHERATELQGHE
jgi:hypothetical protein